MAKQIPSIALAACIVTFSSIGMPTAQAKQQCSAAMPSNPHGRWWSYRFIDGRKCWYEGKPKLSKSLLEWPKQASAQPNSDGELANALTDKPSSPLDSQATAATPVPAPEQKANNTDRSGHAETVLRGDAEKTAAASPNNTDHLVALLLARPEITSVSNLTSKIIAIDDRHSASNDSVRTAIAAAGATEVQLSGGQTKAINRLISGEVSAAVLALVSAEAAEGFPEVAGFKIFRIPLSPRSLKAR